MFPTRPSEPSHLPLLSLSVFFLNRPPRTGEFGELSCIAGTFYGHGGHETVCEVTRARNMPVDDRQVEEHESSCPSWDKGPSGVYTAPLACGVRPTQDRGYPHALTLLSALPGPPSSFFFPGRPGSTSFPYWHRVYCWEPNHLLNLECAGIPACPPSLSPSFFPSFFLSLSFFLPFLPLPHPTLQLLIQIPLTNFCCRN